MSGFDNIINALELLDCNPRVTGDKARAQCPVHGSKGGTLSVKRDGDGGVFYCFAGCEAEDVRLELGLTWDEIYGGRKPVDYVPRVRKPVREPSYKSPVRSAFAYGCRLEYSGDGVHVGRCVCGGFVSAASDGVVCFNGCDVQGVGEALAQIDDVRRIRMAQRKLRLLGCTEAKRGISKAGKEWTIYKVHAEDQNGVPIQEEMQSWENLPVGEGLFDVVREENQYGTRYTVKRPTELAQHVWELQAQMAAVQTHLGITAAPVAAPVPAVVAPVVVESSEVPF